MRTERAQNTAKPPILMIFSGLSLLAACKALASQKSDEQKRGCVPPTTRLGAASQRRSRLEARRRCLVASGARTVPREAPQAKPLLLVPVGVAVA